MGLRRLWNAIKPFWLASLLLLIVAITHIGPDNIGSFYDNPVRAASAWHSVLRAFPESTLLYLLVWLLTPWKPVSVRYAVSAVCAWGGVESFQIAACRLQYPMNQPPPKTELYTGLCDVVTGWPVYMLTIGAVLLVVFLTRPREKPR